MPEVLRLDATSRMQRLLAILRYAAAAPDGVPVQELCDRFGVREGQLVRELEMAMMIGGDSVNYEDMPFEIFFEDGKAFVRLFSLDKPLRLTPVEGLALVAAAGAFVGSEPPDSPLRRGLAKLGALLQIDPEEALEVDLDVRGGPTGMLLHQAAADGRRVRFRYWTYGSDEVSDRVVEPWQVFEHQGAWYVVGHDLDRDATRRFRVDRITEVVVTDDAATATPAPADATIDLGATPRATVDLPSTARWVTEAFPVIDVVELDGGALRVTLAVAGRSWLERLLLRVGPEARVVTIDESLGDPDVLADAAARILARYRSS